MNHHPDAILNKSTTLNVFRFVSYTLKSLLISEGSINHISFSSLNVWTLSSCPSTSKYLFGKQKYQKTVKPCLVASKNCMASNSFFYLILCINFYLLCMYVFIKDHIQEEHSIKMKLINYTRICCSLYVLSQSVIFLFNLCGLGSWGSALCKMTLDKIFIVFFSLSYF